MILGIFFYIWGLLFLAVAILLTIIAVCFLRHARKTNECAQEYMKSVETQTKKEYNKIATLSPKDLGNFLTEIFSRELVLVSKIEISEKDPTASERLYAKAYEQVELYLGQETISAIDFYYGEGYVNRWCTHAYRMVVMSNTMESIVSDKASVEMVKNTL